MKTTIYACYLPGSTTPDYIGSHATTPPEGSAAMLWRYTHCTYLGQGVWISKDTGSLIGPPKLNQKTAWGATLLAMSPIERLSIRIETLSEVDTSQRWTAEAQAIRLHLPQFNTCMKDGPDARKAKVNAYQRSYRKGYFDRNPHKAEAKRIKDKAAAKARRDRARVAKEVAATSHNTQTARPA